MKHTVVLDIGSSKVVCLCGGRVGRDGVAVYGADIQPYAGYRHQQWEDSTQLQEAVIRAVEAAQRECNFRLREVVVSVPAPFMKLHIGEAAVNIGTPGGKPKRITEEDIDMLISESMPEEVPEGYTLMHSTPVYYLLDGLKKHEAPLDLMTERLEAKVSHAYVQEAFLAPIREVLEDMDIEVNACIAAPLAQSLLLVPREKRIKPAVLIDIGYTHTDISVIEHDALLASATIEVGGRHFASDLQYGLKVPLHVAEQAKRRYTFCLDYQDSVELLRTPQGTRQVERATIQYIVEERARELCAMIYETLQELQVDVFAKPFLHVTGGGIGLMHGGVDFMENMLGMKINRETPWMPRMSSPNYSSAFGTLEFVLHASEEDMGRFQESAENGMLRKLKEFFLK